MYLDLFALNAVYISHLCDIVQITHLFFFLLKIFSSINFKLMFDEKVNVVPLLSCWRQIAMKRLKSTNIFQSLSQYFSFPILSVALSPGSIACRPSLNQLGTSNSSSF